MHHKQCASPDYFRGRMEPGLQLARAYVPFQVLGEVYGPAEALCKGTLFPELYMPYHF